MSAGSVVASFPRAVATGLSEPVVNLSAVGKVLASLEKTANRVSPTSNLFLLLCFSKSCSS